MSYPLERAVSTHRHAFKGVSFIYYFIASKLKWVGATSARSASSNFEYELSDGRVLCAHCAQEYKHAIVSHRLVTHAPNCDACDFRLSDF